MASSTRCIDTIPPPTEIKPVKLIVLSAPRCGTKALYNACRELGFTPYHMSETVKSSTRIRIMTEAFDGENGVGTRFTRKDFNKWFAEYDIIIEMPFFCPTSIIQAYPDAKFLLVERDPEKWALSCDNTLFHVSRMLNTFPIIYLKYLQGNLRYFSDFIQKLEKRLTGGRMSGTKEANEEVVNYYEEYSKTVRSLVPPKQLHVLRLEDPVNKYGWKTICPILGVPVPDESKPWPSSNDTEAFKSAATGVYTKLIGRGALIAGLAVVSVAGVISVYKTGRFDTLLLSGLRRS